MIKSTIIEILSNFYILCMRGAKAKFTFRALTESLEFHQIYCTFLVQPENFQIGILRNQPCGLQPVFIPFK